MARSYQKLLTGNIWYTCIKERKKCGLLKNICLNATAENLLGYIPLASLLSLKDS